jgi:hypothetical protein
VPHASLGSRQANRVRAGERGEAAAAVELVGLSCGACMRGSCRLGTLAKRQLQSSGGWKAEGLHGGQKRGEMHGPDGLKELHGLHTRGHTGLMMMCYTGRRRKGLTLVCSSGYAATDTWNTRKLLHGPEEGLHGLNLVTAQNDIVL